jgi:hypothetical protein
VRRAVSPYASTTPTLPIDLDDVPFGKTWEIPECAHFPFVEIGIRAERTAREFGDQFGFLSVIRLDRVVARVVGNRCADLRNESLVGSNRITAGALVWTLRKPISSIV